MRYQDKKILIIGAGQIGEASAIRFSKDHPKEIILHTLTKEESYQAINNIKNKIFCKKSVLKPSWGNLLVPNVLIDIDREDLFADEKKLKLLVDYYYDNLSSSLLKNSSLYQTVKKWKPDLIIDAINTATVVGYLDDPYSLPRSIMFSRNNNKDLDWKKECEKLLSSAIIPCLIRFAQVVEKVLTEFKIEGYIKVSTTGLGGMGVNLMYTHGDLNEPGMSSGILGKVSAAGIFHQLMWSLSHTPGINVKVITPATLVGWQVTQFGKFRSHGKNLHIVDNLNVQKIRFGEILQPDLNTKPSGILEMPFVDSGENCAYSLYEMYAITSLGQMESITKEEVAQAVYESAKGSTKNDILTALDHAALGPTYGAAFQRKVVLSELEKIQKEKKVPSIATNNLGPTVSKHLFELFILFDCVNGLHRFMKNNLREISRDARKYVLENKIVRSQVLSLGLPIIFEGNEYLKGRSIFIPGKNFEKKISPVNLEKWVNAGWVDLRVRRIKYWQNWIRKADEMSKKSKKKGDVNLVNNYGVLEYQNIGEILGLIYSIQGGQRKKEY